MRIEIVGVGSLGTAIARALLATGVVSPGELTLRNRTLTPYLQKLRGEGVTVLSPREEGEGTLASDVVIFAVKPQDATAAIAPWRNFLPPTTLVISVMAGITIGRIEELLSEHSPIIRAMPNLGAQVGRSATAFYCPAHVPQTFLAKANAVFNAFGASWQLLTEELLDAATAIAGSGPAYFCWLAERMIDSAVDFGFEREQAVEMVLHTLFGTSEILKERGGEPLSLRQQVTSRGGTTAAAISVLNDRKCESVFEEAFASARKRAGELARE